MAIRRSRVTFWASGVLLVAAIAWSFRSQPVPVDLAPITRGDLRVTIDEEGMTRVRERYVVSAPVAGRLQRISLQPGDRVEANSTTLATFLPVMSAPLDPRTRAETEARMKASQAAREQSRVVLQRACDEATFSRKELARYHEIAKFGGTTEERLSALELDVRMREAQCRAADLAVQTADHEVEAIAAALQQFAPSASGRVPTTITLRSPVSGVVLRLHQESETPVAAGTPLVEIGNPRELEIVADLLSTDAVKVKPGVAALVTGWGGDKTLRARVRLIEPAGFTKVSALGVEEQRVKVRLDFQNGEHGSRKLGDGYRVEVSLITSERQGVLKVPTSALFRTADRWSVFALRDGRAAQREVQIGERNAIEAEVTSGLEEGDEVIVHPGDTIEDGVTVTKRG